MPFSFSLRQRWSTFRKKIPYRKTVRLMQRYPFRSFFITLGLLLLLIIISNIANFLAPKQIVPVTPTKQVQVYRIGTAPIVSLQAKLEKSGVVKMTSQTSGIVQEIDVNEGDQVSQEQTLMIFSSNYQGGNAPGLQAEIAAKQNEITQSTYQEQKDLIQTQRNLANNQQANNDKLRDISNQSLNDTNSLINLDQDILNTINDNLTTLQNNNVNGQNDQLILQTKELQSQYQSAINQLNNQQRSLSYQTDTGQAYVQIQLDQRDITLKQLDIQEKTLDINKEVSNLQEQLASVNAAVMYPASPCDGVVDRLFVNFGQSVTPGMTLASISCTNQHVKAIVQVPAALASSVSRVQSSSLHLDNQLISQKPEYVSQDATDGTLYSVIYTIPQIYEKNVTDGSYITVDIPIGLPNTGSTDPFIPLDAVYQTQNQAYVYVISHHGESISRMITLGNVYGEYVSVNNGIKSGDQIILDRTIVNGEKVKSAN